MFDMKDYEKKLHNAKLGEGLLCQNISDKPYIAVNDNSDFNNPNNYLVINSKHNGGVGLYFPKDIGFTWIAKESILGNIIQDVGVYLYNKGIPVYGDNNDIMINNKKVIGMTSKQLNDNNFYEGFFITFNPNIDIIKSVCKKEIKKEPIGLEGFGINPKEIIELCKNLIKKYELQEVE